MSLFFRFHNQIVRRPGVYSEIKNRIQNSPIPLSSSALTVIDTGSGAGFFGGSGVNGEFAQEQKSLYKFTSVQDFRSFTRGGLWSDLALPLFFPTIGGDNGISQIEFIKAATTTAPSATYTFTGGGPNGGTLTFKPYDEGTAANGVLGGTSGTQLIKGYGVQMIEAPSDPTSYQIQFYIGTFFGLDTDGDPYDLTEDQSIPELLVTSAPFNTIEEFNTWAASSTDFKLAFTLTSTTVGDGSVDNADFLANQNLLLFAGGTEVYSGANLDLALDNLTGSRSSFILADDFGANAKSTNNLKLATFAASTARFKKQLYVGAGNDASEWSTVNGSLDVAQTYNSAFVTVVHGAVGFTQPDQSQKIKTSQYKAAICLGREAGLAAQVPITNKNLSYDFEVDPLSDQRADEGVQGGIMVTRFDEDFNAFIVDEGVNTIQRNLILADTNAQSYNKQFMRITIELDKGIVVNGKLALFGQPDGINQNTVSREDVQQWLERYLDSVTARRDADNLIIEYKNVEVEQDLITYRVSYRFQPNLEIKAIFVTGFTEILAA